METLADIWIELGSRVRGFVGKRVNDPHAADDITQDVMLKLQTQLDALPPEDKLPAASISTMRRRVGSARAARLSIGLNLCQFLIKSILQLRCGGTSFCLGCVRWNRTRRRHPRSAC